MALIFPDAPEVIGYQAALANHAVDPAAVGENPLPLAGVLAGPASGPIGPRAARADQTKH